VFDFPAARCHAAQGKIKSDRERQMGETASNADPKTWLIRNIVLVGLMGAGKSAIGRRLGRVLGAPFRDSDDEIALAAGMDIPDIFQIHGERAFREGERRVIERLLGGGPMILATGGGAFMDPTSRARLLENACVVWLRADLDTLVARCSKRLDRPLLRNGDPKEILRNLMDLRHPIYAEAQVIVDSVDGPHDEIVNKVIQSLAQRSDVFQEAQA
jgi:shikimate kinase